jgi:hypothetical protein
VNKCFYQNMGQISSNFNFEVHVLSD